MTSPATPSFSPPVSGTQLQQAAPTPEHGLLALATAPNTISKLASTENPEARLLLAEVSVGLTPLIAAAAPKVFQLNRQLGAGTVVKMLVIILRAFVDSLKVPTKPDAADIIEMADTLAQTYTHDSIKDLILALKDMRTDGTKFYQSLDVSTIYRGINTYFEKKAKALANEHYDQVARGASEQAVVVAQLADPATLQILRNVASSLPDTNPLKDTLRRRLRISKARLKRGTITEAEHEQVLAVNRKLATRKDRPDWKPSPEAQKQMDRRHAAEDRRIMGKYSRPAA